MKRYLPDYKNAHVLVVGDIMLDRYWSGSTSRISPEAPVPVIKINSMEERPGGAANVAMNITSLHGHTQLIGFTGDDESAKILKDRLTNQAVVCDFVIAPGHLTVTKLRILSRHQQLIRLDFEEGFTDIEKVSLLEKVNDALKKVKLLIISDYAKGVLMAVPEIIKMANKMNIPILIDPKGDNFEYYRGATLLTPNMDEFEAVVGSCQTEKDIVKKGRQLIKKYNLHALLVTRSEKGMTLLQLNEKPVHLPTEAKEVYDVTGAGDTVIAALGASLAAGSSLEDACWFANAAAGIVVGKLGTSTVSQVELEDALKARMHQGIGLMTEEQLKIAVKEARIRGEKIVMTNGCFDLLHAGHVSYLANARQKGDRLIVAVNSDNSVKKLKGKDRPINSVVQRMQVLGALEAVDWVVSFDEDTPRRLIGEILPDVLVKGGDYNTEMISGGAEVIAAGGHVEVLNFEDGFSTTNMINAIKKL